MKNPSTRQKGDRGETIALEYLISSGYTILETNWSAHKAEIDIIAKEADTLIFIEVKTRTSPTAHALPNNNSSPPPLPNTRNSSTTTGPSVLTSSLSTTTPPKISTWSILKMLFFPGLSLAVRRYASDESQGKWEQQDGLRPKQARRIIRPRNGKRMTPSPDAPSPDAPSPDAPSPDAPLPLQLRNRRDRLPLRPNV
ncbi:MAG: YraN family protein [Saprospiraceae bacterium]|nr:YraN family protein [Saprospiraceae bacterium]